MADIERLSALLSDPEAELKRLEGEVRHSPSDARLRTYLFQLLVIRGDWERAVAQLQVTAQLSGAALAMAQTYREAIRCEVFRAEVFAGRRQPSILGTPPSWSGLLLEALRELGQGHVVEAEQLRAKALDDAPATPCRIGDASFEWIADMDSRLGPICEAIVDGKYVWIPFEHLAALHVDPPSDLRDLVWASAGLRFTNGGETVALIPTRYPGSEHANDVALAMARKTTWEQRGDDTYVGLGQRMWATDGGEFPMLEACDITFGAQA